MEKNSYNFFFVGYLDALDRRNNLIRLRNKLVDAVCGFTTESMFNVVARPSKAVNLYLNHQVTWMGYASMLTRKFFFE